MTDTINISVKETCDLFREYGWQIGPEFLSEGIRTRVFDFGIAIKGKEYRYYISRALTIAFLDKWAGKK